MFHGKTTDDAFHILHAMPQAEIVYSSHANNVHPLARDKQRGSLVDIDLSGTTEFKKNLVRLPYDCEPKQRACLTYPTSPLVSIVVGVS